MTDEPQTDPLDVPLPADIKVNHICFRKGVSLRTFVKAARRWHTVAVEAAKLKQPGGVGQTARDALRIDDGGL